MKLLILFINGKFHAAEYPEFQHQHPHSSWHSQCRHAFPAANAASYFGCTASQCLHQDRWNRLRSDHLEASVPGPDRIAVTDFPGSDSHLICHHMSEVVSIAETGLGNSKTAEMLLPADYWYNKLFPQSQSFR